MQSAQQILNDVTGSDSYLGSVLAGSVEGPGGFTGVAPGGYGSVQDYIGNATASANIPAGMFGYATDIPQGFLNGSSGTPQVLGTQQGPVASDVASYLGVDWPWNSGSPANNLLGQLRPGASSTGQNPSQSSLDSFLEIISNIPRMLSIIIGLIMIIAGLYMLGNRSVNTAVSILASEKGAKLL